MGIATVVRTRKACVMKGIEATLNPTRRPYFPPRRLDGEGEAQLVHLACSEAPAGWARWTLRLLADRLVELNVVGGIAHETVRRTLKNKLKP